MSTNLKKILVILGIIFDIGITIFLFVISIIMITRSSTMSAVEIANATGFIGYLQNHTTFYLCLFVVPLFVILGINIIILVMYSKKSDKKKDVKVADLSDEQKEALKKQLLDELTKK